MNGLFCADNSASHNCPKTCKEDEGEVLCAVYEDDLGCKPEALCMTRSKPTHGKENLLLKPIV